MNDQALSGLRWVLTMACGVAVGRGWITVEQSTTLVGLIIVAVPSVVSLGTFVWGLVAHSKQARIASVAAMPEVKKIETDSATAAAAPSVKVVSTRSGL